MELSGPTLMTIGVKGAEALTCKQCSVTLDVLLAKLFPSTVGQARQLPSAYYVFCVLSFFNLCRLLLIILEVVFRARPRTFNAMHSSLLRHALKS